MDKKEILKKIDNALFLSKEEPNRIEHVDMGYKELMRLLNELAK